MPDTSLHFARASLGCLLLTFGCGWLAFSLLGGLRREEEATVRWWARLRCSVFGALFRS
jgi:hypothetical protein